MSNLDVELRNLGPLQKKSLTAGGVAIALCFAGAYFNRQQFFQSYLTAYLFWIGIPLGCWGLVMIHHLVGGTWGFVIQRPLESGIRTLPVMALLFIPIFFGMPDLYSWARPDALAHDEILRQKTLYLNIPFFALRTVLYFAIWISVGYFLTKWSREQDHRGDASLVDRLQYLSGPGLVLFGLTVTFSVIDWSMSLEPRWYSTIYGMIFMVSDGLVAMAFVIGVAYFLARRETLSGVFAPWVFHDLGNLLLAFVMLWAYLSFSQFLLIWVENLKNEIPWYLHRITGGWGAIAMSLIVVQFALPFVLLLSRAVKRKPATLFGVAVVIGAMHLVEIFWFVAPTFHPSGFSISWMDLAAPIAIGGFWFAAFLWSLQGRSLLPARDPRFVAIVEEYRLVKDG
ncbi:MAG TPA: hypothetical protein VIE89_36715 [Candidatus Binatia bacterium]